MTAKYLYLTKAEYADAWVHGGRVPLGRASNYKRIERGEVYTPAEGVNQAGRNLSAEDAEELRRVIQGPAHIYAGVLLGGDRPRTDVQLRYENWDGILLCLSNSESRAICRRLGKKACVRIAEPERILRQISEQLGTLGQIAACVYTEEPVLDVFTKPSLDSWQDEFRMYWDTHVDDVEVEIPAGTGQLLWVLEAENDQRALMSLVLAEYAAINGDGTFTIVRGGITRWRARRFPLEVSLSLFVSVRADQLTSGRQVMHVRVEQAGQVLNEARAHVEFPNDVDPLRVRLPINTAIPTSGTVVVTCTLAHLVGHTTLEVTLDESS